MPAMTAAAGAPRPDAVREEPPRMTSAALLRGGRKLVILHAGESYTLQVTRQNKLLLTK